MPSGIWAWDKASQCKAVVLDGITNKPVQVNPDLLDRIGSRHHFGSQITCGSSTGTVTVRAVATGTEYFTSSADKTFNVTNKQGQTIFFKQGEKGGLRDSPPFQKTNSHWTYGHGHIKPRDHLFAHRKSG